MDYKIAYRDSVYHIRYDDETFAKMTTQYSVFDPIRETSTEKLWRHGLIETKDLGDAQKIADATK